MVFLETSAQGERLFGRRDGRRRFEDVAQRSPCRTSVYVWEEFRCSFLRDAVLFHQLILEEEGDVSSALERADGFPLTGRQQRRVRQVYRDLLRHPLCERLDDVTELLEVLIEGGLQRRFWRGLDREQTVDETQCRRGGEAPQRLGPSYVFTPRCRVADPPQCKIAKFWQQHETELRALHAACDALPDDLKRPAHLAGAVAEGEATPRGTNCFRELADCVIACEAPAEDEILTTNLCHFEPICKVVGRKLLDLPAQFS